MANYRGVKRCEDDVDVQLTAETMQTYDLKKYAVTQSNDDSALRKISISSLKTA